MKRFYKASILFFILFTFFLQKNYAQISVGIKEGVGNKVIVYMTTTSPLNAYPFDDFTVTIKWPESTVSSSNFSSSYSINPAAPQVNGGFNYIICNTANLGSITLDSDGTELTLFTIDYTYLPSGDCSGEFEISDDIWTQTNGGTLNLIDGFNGTTEWNPAISQQTAADLSPVKISNVVKQDIKCRGEATGQIGITAEDELSGILNYNIGLGNQGNPIFSSLTQGNYSISVTNGNCTASYSATINITQPATSVSISSQVATDISCYNANDGKIVITAAGGTGTLQYSINAGSTYQVSETFPDLAASNYNIRVKDAEDCVVTGSSRTINNPQAITIQNQTKTDITCFGNNDGSITMTAVGGTGTLNFSKDNGSNYLNNGGIFANLSPDSYLLKVKDNNNCEVAGDPTSIIEPTIVTISNIATTPVSLCSASDGEINVTASGGTGSLQYSNGGVGYQSANSFSGLTRGNYTVYVRDEKLCTVSQRDTIFEENPIVIESISVNTLDCYGDLDGEIIIVANGGLAPLTYSRDNTNYYSSNIFNNLPGSNYACFVKDANNCYIYEQVIITQPTPIELTIADVTNITTCFGDNVGMIRFSGIGGTGSLEYSLNGETFQPSSQFLNIPGGNYMAVAKDENQCETTISAIVIQPDELISNIDVTNISCASLGDGEIKVAPDGGTPNYSIVWSATDGDDDDNYLSDLQPGRYFVTITDANSCQSKDTVDITMPEAIAVNSEVENLTCFGSDDGTISIVVTGGEAPYRYRWNNNQMSANIDGLDAGEYSVSITDFRQCKKVFNVTIIEPNALSLHYEIYNTTYTGSDDGRIVLDITGGTEPYFYNWSNGDVTDSIYNLPTGDYFVTVQDAHFCEITQSCKISTDQTDVEIPSAFTPNGDGKNDVWILKSIVKYPSASLKIFDSRGYLVYTKDDGNIQGWDGTDNSGTPLPGSSLYYYVIEVNKNTAPFKGTVYIIR